MKRSGQEHTASWEGDRVRLVIATPENVRFELDVAALPSRAIAWLIDLVVMAGLLGTGTTIAQFLEPLSRGLSATVVTVAAFGVQWWYGALCEFFFKGQTLGKRAIGLRVVTLDGRPLTFSQAVTRNLCRVIDLLPGTYLVGGVVALLDPLGRRLGDLAARTLVVRRQTTTPPSLLAAGAALPFAKRPEVKLCARRVHKKERRAMEALTIRRHHLTPSVRGELFSELATHLERRLRCPRPAELSPENYVMAVMTAASSEFSSKNRTESP